MTFDNALQLLVIAWSVVAMLAATVGLIMAIVVFVKLMKGMR